MTSDFVIVSIKLSPELWNDEHIFGGHSMSGFEVIEGGGGSGAPPSQEAKKARSAEG